MVSVSGNNKALLLMAVFAVDLLSATLSLESSLDL